MRLSLFGVCLLAVAAFAIEPPHFSNEELAKFPIVVEARWSGKAITDHSEVNGNVLKTWELRTEIVVERVVRGDVKPGTYTLLLGWPTAWEKEGGPVLGYSSTQVIGDVSEVKDRNLWFLRRGRSWDKEDPGPYLMLNTYRGVQPLALEPLFDALNKKDSHAAIARLLQVKADPRIAMAGLTHICGGHEMPWPYESWWVHAYKDQPDLQPKPEFRKEYAKSVARLLEHDDASVRACAAAVFSEMAGQQGVPRLRRLLEDPDGSVRGVAVGTLARWRDETALEAIARAAPGIEDAHLACQVIERLGEWGHEGTVPALIPFLQEDEVWGYSGDDISMPALKAQAALEKVTGHLFPCDVAAATRAWASARLLPTEAERRAFLAARLRAHRKPFAAQCLRRGDGASFALVLENVSGERLLVPRRPQRGDVYVKFDEGGSTLSGCGFDGITGPADFAWVEPRATLEIPVELGEDFGSARPGKRTMTVWFFRNGNEWGLNAWLGRVEVQVAWGR